MTKRIGKNKRPLICAPLVGAAREFLISELQQVLAKKPDIVEWRADYFAEIADTEAVIQTAGSLKKAAGDIPLIFTIRSEKEGGQPIRLNDKEVIELNAEICRSTQIEYIDCELRNPPEYIRYLRRIASENDTGIIGSFHNFKTTPTSQEMFGKFETAVHYGLDVAKVAVMPQDLEDVLTLLSITHEAKQKLAIPIITVSMGKYGALSRIVGGVFGSSLTFAVGSDTSAPGQLPIEDVKTVLNIIDRNLGED